MLPLTLITHGRLSMYSIVPVNEAACVPLKSGPKRIVAEPLTFSGGGLRHSPIPILSRYTPVAIGTELPSPVTWAPAYANWPSLVPANKPTSGLDAVGSVTSAAPSQRSAPATLTHSINGLAPNAGGEHGGVGDVDDTKDRQTFFRS